MWTLIMPFNLGMLYVVHVSYIVVNQTLSFSPRYFLRFQRDIGTSVTLNIFLSLTSCKETVMHSVLQFKVVAVYLLPVFHRFSTRIDCFDGKQIILRADPMWRVI